MDEPQTYKFRELPPVTKRVYLEYKSDDALAKQALESVAVITIFFGQPRRLSRKTSNEVTVDDAVRQEILKVAAVVHQEAFLYYIPFDSGSVGPSSIMDVQSATWFVQSAVFVVLLVPMCRFSFLVLPDSV